MSNEPTGLAAPSAATTPAGPRLALIAAVARNGAIGRHNQLVWRHPDDAKWLRQQTWGCPVIMGRKTWESLPPKFRPLPGRRNIVVTGQAGWQAAGAQVAHSLSQALDLADDSAVVSGAERIFILGGGQLYAEALPQADELVLTEVKADLEGDTFFPAWDRSHYTETFRQHHGAVPQPDGTHAPAFDFVVYKRTR